MLHLQKHLSYDSVMPRNALYWLYTQEVVLYQSDFDHPDKLKNPVPETWNAAVLDSGATKYSSRQNLVQLLH